MKSYYTLLIYLISINLISLISMGIDKWKAKHKKWRIPEKTLFILAALGGSIGSIAGMTLFRHKTRHQSFRIGIPVILVIQIVIFLMMNNIS